MKKMILCALIAALLLSALPAGALAAKGSGLAGIGLIYEGDSVTLGEKLGKFDTSALDWSSSDESVATAVAGRIDAKSPGRAVITASYMGAEARCGVVVLPRELTVRVGERASLPSAGKEKYYVEDGSVARIDQKGEITGREAGFTRIGVACGKQRMIVQLSVVDGELLDKQSAAAQLDCANETDQIILVDYQGGSSATLSIHSKQFGAWTQVYSCSAYVGRNGIGKQSEGDGKTPTGTFNLIQPFGIQPDPGSNMGYTQVTEHHYWCGSSDSPYYNQLVDERSANRACTSSDEHLIDYKGVYDYCMFIDYNASGEPGKGSCIFLHCKGKDDSTAGCIAVSETVMKNIIQWAKPGAKIVIR